MDGVHHIMPRKLQQACPDCGIIVFNLDNGMTEEYTLVAEGRRSSRKVSTEGPEGNDPSVHNANVIYLSDLIKWSKKRKQSRLTFPHRRLLKVDRTSLVYELTIGFKQAEAFRKANGQYARQSQWQDITVEVII